MKKQATNETNSNPDPGIPNRRSFLTLLWAGLGLTALVEAFWIGFSFLSPGKLNRDSSSQSLIKTGPVDTFAPDSVTPHRKGGFFLSRLENGGFLAISSRCSHMGCAINWDPVSSVFRCPCHSSSFDIRGEVLRSPATRPLDYYPVTISQGVVYVHLEKPQKRQRFHPEQVTMS